MGVFIGYDNPQPMGHGETGGELAAPVFADFFKLALKDKPAIPFRTPQDLRMVMVNRKTGLRTGRDDPDAIEEYFKPGTEPSEGYQAAEGYRRGEEPGTPAEWGGVSRASPLPPSNFPQPYGREPHAGGLY
jgi:penicillin-binding protein 1A